MKPGTPYYYAFRFAPLELREPLNVLYRFNQELALTVKQGIEPHITQMKLNWWSQEVSRLYNGQPSHPLSPALQEVVQEYQITQDKLQNIINGHVISMNDTVPATYSALLDHARNVAAPLFILYAQLLSPSAQTTTFATQLSIALFLIDRINGLGQDWRQNKLFIPQEEFAQQHSKSEDFPSHCPPEFLPKALEKIATQAETSYQQALAALPVSERPALLSLLILGEIQKTLLHEIAHAQFAVLPQHFQLTPLRQLWIAWRTHLTISHYRR